MKKFVYLFLTSILLSVLFSSCETQRASIRVDAYLQPVTIGPKVSISEQNEQLTVVGAIKGYISYSKQETRYKTTESAYDNVEASFMQCLLDEKGSILNYKCVNNIRFNITNYSTFQGGHAVISIEGDCVEINNNK